MKKFRILIAPLDWGLGHASRSVPVIQHLLDLGADVILAGDGDSLDLLKKEFPKCPSVTLKNFPISYPDNNYLLLHFLFKLPGMINHVRKEHLEFEKIAEDFHIDAVISDNRYGLYHKFIPTVLLTHQLNPKASVFSRIVRKFLHKLILRFDHCWIPDYDSPAESLAGELSINLKNLSNVTYVGPVSRFETKQENFEYEVIAILSGPEPQRTMLEEIIVNQLPLLEGRHLIVRGSSSVQVRTNPVPNNIEFEQILDSRTLDTFINQSRYIVCRAGYSSIMDLVVKERQALLIPTPGQKEQEYLADCLGQKKRFIIQQQDKTDLKKGLEEIRKLPKPKPFQRDRTLETTIRDFYEALY